MWQTNLKLTLRSLLKNKTQSAILISGLTIGMAACILLLQYVSFELSYDDFHTEKENIYRVVNERFQNGASVQKGTITYPTIGPAMKEEFPEVKNATRLTFSSDVMISHEDRVEPIETGLWVDKHFFEIFDFELLSRAGIKLMDESNEIILSRTLADRYFPGAKGDYEAILGEEIQIDTYEENFKIVGVCENVPANSHLQFKLLLSYPSTFRYWGEGADNSWTWSDFYHYLQLEPGTDVSALEAKFSDFSQRHFRGTEVSGSEEVFTLQALEDAHLYSTDLEYEIGRTVNGSAVWSLLIIAFFILFIAWINYVNLSSVRAIERSKEVGVRKVIGATQGQLIRQFFTEALLTNILSLILALVLVQALRPWFATNLEIELAALSFFSGYAMHAYLLISLLLLILGGVLISGAYPAWLLSSSQVSNVLKGVFSKAPGGAWLRKGLVVIQFTLSIGLITATWLVSKQIAYMSQQDLGIDIEQVMTINSPEMSQWDSTFIERMDAFKGELVKLPGVQSATSSSRTPGNNMGRLFHIQKIGEENSEQTFTSNFINADHDFAETYGISPLAGRFFRREDHNYNFDVLNKITVNESASKMLGYKQVEDAIGKEVSFWNKTWKIVGVIPNFHQKSLHHPIEPIFFVPTYSTSHAISLKIDTKEINKTITGVQAIYAQFFPGNTFSYSFVDEFFQRLYQSDQRFSRVLSFFTLLTILIACLGLFGLSSYMTFLRTKEIGIRKVLGASIISIVGLLSKDFLRLVIIAIIIAAPLAYYFTKLWLADFAFRIEIPWWVFMLSGGIAVLLAIVTVSAQSIRAAIANPGDSLKNE